MKWNSALGVLAVVGCAFEWHLESLTHGTDADGPPKVQEERAARPLADASWDQLIAEIPDRNGEFVLDPASGKRTLHPAVVEVATRLARGERPTDGQWVAALRRSGAVHSREVWPVGLPWAVSLHVPAWLGRAHFELHPRSLEFEVAHEDSVLVQSSCFDGIEEFLLEFSHDLSHVRPGDQRVTFDAVVRWERAPYTWQNPKLPFLDRQVVWEGTITYPIRGVSSVAEVLPPARDAGLDEAVKRAVSVELAGNSLRLTYSPGDEPLLQGLALAFDAEVRQGGRLLATGKFPRVSGVMPRDSAQPASRNSHLGLAPEVLAQIREGGTCTLHLRGVSDNKLLLDWAADRHYAGSFELAVQ